MGNKGVELKEVVRAACKHHGLDFEKIVKVSLNDDLNPTKVLVEFEGDVDPLELDIQYPLSS